MNAYPSSVVGAFDLRCGAETIVQQATACALLFDGSAILLANPVAVVEPIPGGWRAEKPGTGSRPGLWLEIRHNSDYLSLKTGLHNTTDQPLGVLSLAPLVTASLDLKVPPAEWSFYRMGWQSWSPAGTTTVVDDRLSSAPPVVAPVTAETTDSQLTTAWGAILRGRPDCLLLVGFISARQQTSIIRLTRAGELRAVCDLEHGRIEPGQTVESETLFVACGSEADGLLQVYGGAIGAAMGAIPPGPSVTGWCTWYRYFGSVREQDVLDNLQRLKSEGWTGKAQVIQLDDGYETTVGDWLTLNSKFPHGLKWLADQIRAAGFKPGLWLAPFTVSPKSQLFADHPDWVVHDESGEPLSVWRDFDWDVELYGLDCTHPAVLAWLTQVFRTVVAEWGFEYLKLDFLYSGALPGQRYAAGVTGLAAYRQGLRHIREVVGDVFILGCGAPLLPSVGLVDAMRIGPDVAPFWKPNPRDTQRVWPSVENAARNTLARYWMHGRLWHNDADCLLVRDRDTQLTRQEVETWATLVGLSGSSVIWSDALADVGLERVRLVEALLPPLGQAAQPEGLLDAEKPAILNLAVDRPFGGWRVVGLFNWDDGEQAKGYDLDRPVYVYEFWSRTHYGLRSGHMQFDLAPHGCVLLSLRAPAGRPQLVGSTFHVSMGGAELADERWDVGRRALVLQLHTVGQRQGRLVIAWPEGFQLQQVTGPLANWQTQAGPNWLELDGSLAGEATFAVEFAGPDGAGHPS